MLSALVQQPCAERRSGAAQRRRSRARSAQCTQAGSDAVDVSRRAAVLGALAAAALLKVDGAAAAPAGTVLVVGATGGVGSRVVTQLLAAGYTVRAGCRDVTKPAALLLQRAGAELVHVDVTESKEALQAALGSATAVVCCTGYTPSFNFGKDSPHAVDGDGTIRLAEVSVANKVERFILVTSLLTNAAAVGQKENPNYKFLNALGGILDEKRRAELAVQRSGLAYTIVRPGGLSNEPPAGNLMIAGEDTFFGLDSEAGREISRDTVAAFVVAALGSARAERRVFEIVASDSAPRVAKEDWFA